MREEKEVISRAIQQANHKKVIDKELKTGAQTVALNLHQQNEFFREQHGKFGSSWIWNWWRESIWWECRSWRSYQYSKYIRQYWFVNVVFFILQLIKYILANKQPAGSSIFGNNSTQNAAVGNMFGGGGGSGTPTQAPSTSLFGGSNTTPAAPSTSTPSSNNPLFGGGAFSLPKPTDQANNNTAKPAASSCTFVVWFYSDILLINCYSL